MCDYFDDFDGEFMDDELFEDDIEEDFDESEVEDPLDDEPMSDNDLNHNDDRSNGHEWDDAYWIGGAMGFAYGEGLDKGRRKNLEKEMDVEGNKLKRKGDGQ